MATKRSRGRRTAFLMAASMPAGQRLFRHAHHSEPRCIVEHLEAAAGAIESRSRCAGWDRSVVRPPRPAVPLQSVLPQASHQLPWLLQNWDLPQYFRHAQPSSYLPARKFAAAIPACHENARIERLNRKPIWNCSTAQPLPNQAGIHPNSRQRQI